MCQWGRYAAQVGAKSIFKPDDRCQCEGSPAGQCLFQGGQADPSLVGQPLPRQAAPRQLLADAQRDRLTAFNFDIDMHGPSLTRAFCPYPHISAHFVNKPRVDTG